MSERVAVLVIHGIGEEQPYGTLDQFTRGLLDELDKDKDWTIEPIMSQEPDPTRPGRTYARVGYRTSPPPTAPARFRSDKVWSERLKTARSQGVLQESEYSEISLFEYYWSPITKNKVKYTTSLFFLIKAGLQPFKYFASNIAAISTASAGPRRRASEPADGPLRIIIREVVRQAFLFLPIILFLLWLLYLLSTKGSLTSLGKSFEAGQLPGELILTAVLVGIRYLYLYTNFKALFQPAWRGADISTTWWWRLLLIVGILFHLFFWPFGLRPVLHGVASVGTYAVRHSSDLRAFTNAYDLHWASATRSYANDFLWSLNGQPFLAKLGAFFILSPGLTPYLKLAALLLLAWFVRHILINYIGDLAVYTNPNQLSENYAARAQIMEGCTTALVGILKQAEIDANGESKPRFDRVLVAGHSLGSVIGYDALNGVLNLARTEQGITDSDLRRIRGLVTFGCPLNKIYYFFRELDDPGATLRHRTLDLIHAFRLKPSLATNLPPVFAAVDAWTPYDLALHDGFTWINAYSLADPVSGRLLFYNVGRADPDPGRAGVFVTAGAQEQLWLGLFGFAHTRYWKSQAFYRFVVNNLL